MSEHPPDDDDRTAGLPPSTRLFDLVSRCQVYYLQLEQERDAAAQTRLKDELAAVGYELWEELRGALIHKVRRKVRRRMSGAFRDALNNPASYPNYDNAVEALAKSSMLGLFEAIPRIKLDPSKNVQAYLTTVAWYGLVDMEKEIYDEYRKQRETPIIQVSLEYMLSAVDDGHQHEELLRDERTPDVVSQVIDEQLSHALTIFFASTLSVEDQRIVAARLQTPPVSYEGIVAQLGKGWTTAAARQRFARAMRRTRVFLQENQWI